MTDKSINTFNVSNVSEFNSDNIGKIDVLTVDPGDCIVVHYDTSIPGQDINTLSKVKDKLKQAFPNNTVMAVPNWINLSVVKRG
jgi:hypothetical protein